MPNLWGHWTDLNQTWTHNHLWLLFEKFGPNSPGIYSPRAGGKKPLWGPILNYDQTHHYNGTCQQSEKKLVNLQGLPYMAPKFGELWSRNGWERLASLCLPPYIFALRDTASLTAWRSYNRLQANFGTCDVVARARTECRAGSCWALPCI